MKMKEMIGLIGMVGLYVNYINEKPFEIIQTDDIHNESFANVDSKVMTTYSVSGSNSTI